MEEVLYTANELFSSFLGLPVVFSTCRTTQHGDIFCPQGTAESLKAKIAVKGMKLEDVLEKDKERCFSRVTFNPHGQLCVSLNRPLLFANCVHSVVSLGGRYGNAMLLTQADQCEGVHTVSLVNHTDPSIASGARDPVSKDCTAGLTVADGRNILLTGLLANVLTASGCRVNCVNYIAPTVAPGKHDPSDLVWRLLSPFASSGEESHRHNDDIPPDQFLSSLPLPPLSDHTSSRGRLTVNAGAFLRENSLTGKHGYDKNLDHIQVTDERGHLNDVASVSCKICAVCHVTHGGSHMIIHIADQRRSFSVQQSVALSEIYCKANKQHCTQHLLPTSGVDCSRNGVAIKDTSLQELIRRRLQQMTQVYIVRYGDRARGPQLQELATRMTEAVIKFELLSSDLSATVKLDLPDIDQADTSVRFPGAFVLYNYARLATVLSTFEGACERGVYPPLPAVSSADFSLLTDEEEWKLLFHYVLRYPMAIKEAARIKRKGVGVHIDVCLKKVCLFLNELSHAVSSYYSRVKILLPPEPHLLPLIFARLHLVSAVRQVMNNALRLLNIDPINQL